MRLRVSPFVLCCLVFVSSSTTVCADEPNFEQQIAPLIARRCLGCHSGDDPQGDLDLTTRTAMLHGGESGAALVPGDLETSELWQRVSAGDMPPKAALAEEEQQLLRAWIQAGAKWGDHPIDPLRYSSEARAGYDWWSLQPLNRPPVPSRDSRWNRNAIDGFVAQRRETAGLTASPEADRRTLIRRLCVDLLGLPPTPEDVEYFLSDPAPDAYEQLVERYLASPHYGERWGRHWLDVVRYGESNGFERDLPRENAWHYRDWVIEALNRDMPYDEFVRWQLAADAYAEGDPNGARALGFLVAGPHDTVIPVSIPMRQTMRQDELEDLVGVVGQTFLGLTVNCARCHDHKFDPIAAREYYQLAAVFSGIEHAERTVMAPAAERQLASWQERIASLESDLRREATEIAKTLKNNGQTAPPTPLPTPLAEWDFTQDLRDRVGGLHGVWHGKEQQTSEGILLDGASYVSTPPLASNLGEKTLEVRAKLANLDQRGGGLISVQSLDGSVFDAVVFGEQQPRHWLAGSNNFSRTKSFGGVAEELAAREFVTLTYVYQADGTIVAYRDGQPYGHAYHSEGPVKFAAGQTQILFGLRHGQPGGNRLLHGTIQRARLYPRALNPVEVADSVGRSRTFLTEAELNAIMTPDALQRRHERLAELQALKSAHARLSQSAPIKVYTAALNQPTEMRILRRGSVADPGDVVSPAGLAAVVGWSGDLGLAPDALEHQRRRRLAEWLTDSRNPLFARVMANRLWHYHFGTGLVATPNDLGFNGGHPTHPDLLDWLATELIESGYSLKHLHRLMVTSATYRQSSQHRTDAAGVDADNRLLWRMSPRRLDAESLRDALLLVAGELNPAIGGKGYVDFDSHFFKGTQFYDPIDPQGYETQRRTIYRMWARGGRNPFLDTFDCPDPSTSTPDRSTTTTPLQALSLLNNPLSRRMAARLADRVVYLAGEDLDNQIRQVYQYAYARDPTAEELELVGNFARQHGLAATCRGLLNSSEFLVID